MNIQRTNIDWSKTIFLIKLKGNNYAFFFKEKSWIKGS